jgi:hypothetical protein
MTGRANLFDCVWGNEILPLERDGSLTFCCMVADFFPATICRHFVVSKRKDINTKRQQNDKLVTSRPKIKKARAQKFKAKKKDK